MASNTLFSFMLQFVRANILITEDAVFCLYITKFIKTVFPSKKITPIDFRRVLPSIIFAEEISPEGVSMVDFLRDYAGLLCTSEKILLEHYIRANADDKNKRAIQVIHDEILVSVEGIVYDLFIS